MLILFKAIKQLSYLNFQTLKINSNILNQIMSLKPKVLKFNRYASHAALKKSLMSLDTPRFEQQDSRQKETNQIKQARQLRPRKNSFWTKKGLNINGSIQSRLNGQSQHNSIGRNRRALSGKTQPRQQSSIGAQKVSIQRQFLQIPNTLRGQDNTFHQHNSKFNIILKHQKQWIQDMKPILEQKNLRTDFFEKAFQGLSKCLQRVQQIKLFDLLPSLKNIVSNHIEGSSYVFSKLVDQYQNLYRQKFTDYDVILNDMKKEVSAINFKNQQLQNQNKVLKMISIEKAIKSTDLNHKNADLYQKESDQLKMEIMKTLDLKVSQIAKQLSNKQSFFGTIPKINYQRVFNDQQSQSKLRTGAVDTFCDRALNKILLNQADTDIDGKQNAMNGNAWKQLSIHNSILETIQCTENSIPAVQYLLSKEYKVLSSYTNISKSSPKKGSPNKGSPQKGMKRSAGKYIQRSANKSPHKRNYGRPGSSGFTLVEKLVKQLINNEVDTQVLYQMKDIFLRQVQRIKRVSKGFNIRARDKKSTLRGIENKNIKISLQELLLLVQKVQFLNSKSKNLVDIEFQNELKYQLISKTRTESGSIIPQHYLNILIHFFQGQSQETKDIKDITNQANIFTKVKQNKMNSMNLISENNQNANTPIENGTFYQGSNMPSMKNKRLINCLNLLESRSIRMRSRTAKQTKSNKENAMRDQGSEQQSTNMNTIQSSKPCKNLLFNLISSQNNNPSSQSQQILASTKLRVQDEIELKMKHLSKVKIDPIDCIAAMYYYFMEQLHIMRRQLTYEATKSSNPYSNKNYLQRYIDIHLNFAWSNQSKDLNQLPSQSITFYKKYYSNIKKVQDFYERATRYSDKLALNPADVNKKQCLQNTIDLVLKPVLMQCFADRINSSAANSPNKNNSHMTSINTSAPNSDLNYLKHKVKVSNFQ